MPDPTPPFHPDLAAAARWTPRAVVRPWTIPLFNAFFSLGGALVSGGEPVALGAASLWLYRPAEPGPTPGPAVLWLHGGGFVVGHARQDGARCQALADALGVPVASVQYRLATAHPFPAALDDAMAALAWLADLPEVDGSWIAVAGQSAGAGLAAQLAQRAAAEGRVVPCQQLLIYPMLDDRSSDAAHPHAEAFRMWDAASNRLGWDRYLRGHDREDPPPHAVPARADALAGLPPAWIGVGTLDLFHDEDVAYARRLEAAGVPTTLEVVDGAFHGFDALAPDAPVTRAFEASQRAALRARWAALGWTPPASV